MNRKPIIKWTYQRDGAALERMTKKELIEYAKKSNDHIIGLLEEVAPIRAGRTYTNTEINHLRHDHLQARIRLSKAYHEQLEATAQLLNLTAAVSKEMIPWEDGGKLDQDAI